MDILKQSPSPAQIEECIRATDTSADVELLRLVSTLLKYTVSESYLSLPESCQTAIARVFRTVVGLGNLVARIGMFCRSKTDLHRDVSRALDAHTRLLEQVLSTGLVSEISASASLVAIKELDKLLFKGKTYAIVREAASNFSNFHIPAVLQNLDAYASFLARELLVIDDSGPFMVSLFSLGSSDVVFDVFFSPENAQSLRKAVKSLKRFERKSVLVKFLDYAVSRHFKTNPSNEAAAALSILIKSVFDTSIIDELLLEKVISKYNFTLSMTVALLIDNSNDLISKSMKVWGSQAVVNNEPIVKQGYRTHLLLCLCAHLPSQNLNEIIKSSGFVSAITSRLSSLSHQVKLLGVFFADHLCKMAQAQPIFDMSGLDDVRQLNIPSNFIKNSEFSLIDEDAWEILHSPQVIEADAPEKDVGVDLKQLSLTNDPKASINTAAEDINMSDEEDDPTLASRDKIATPIYIRDLLSYLSLDSKAKNAYEKRKIALEATPTLLRQKSSFGNEVSFYSQDLLAQLVGLSNDYDETTFEVSRLNAMIAVVVSDPKVTEHLCHLLLTGDYSLQQRLSLLSALSFGARALRGYEDKAVKKSFVLRQFPSEMLPKKLHDQYSAADPQNQSTVEDFGYAQIENSIQNTLMEEASENAKDELSGGRILRISAKLRKEPQLLVVSKDRLLNFNEIVGKQFFFPLVAVWFESGGINIGHYTPVLIAHYLRTLSLILHCAYPSAIDMTDMAGEYLTLVTPVLQKVNTDELQVIESIVTGVLLVCETVDPRLLITSFSGSLHIIESVISQWWELLIDERVKSLCAGLLLRLNSLKDNMERTLLDQMNGGLFA